MNANNNNIQCHEVGEVETFGNILELIKENLLSPRPKNPRIQVYVDMLVIENNSLEDKIRFKSGSEELQVIVAKDLFCHKHYRKKNGASFSQYLDKKENAIMLNIWTDSDPNSEEVFGKMVNLLMGVVVAAEIQYKVYSFKNKQRMVKNFLRNWRCNSVEVSSREPQCDLQVFQLLVESPKFSTLYLDIQNRCNRFVHYNYPLPAKDFFLKTGEWVVKENLKNMQCTRFEAQDVDLTAFEINEFLENWRAGDCQNLKHLKMEFKDPMNFCEIIKDLELESAGKGSEKSWWLRRSDGLRMAKLEMDGNVFSMRVEEVERI